MIRRWPQLLRKATQIGVLVFIVYAAFGSHWRNYKVAHNSARLVALIHGDTWGDLYAANEAALETFGDPYEASTMFLGMPWASRVAGVDGADPVMVASHAVVSGGTTAGLLVGLVVPLLLAALLGKVFCSHLCPARLAFEIGELVRAGLERIGVTFPAYTSEARLGGWVLLGGLLAALGAGTAVWFFVLPYLAISVGVYLYVAAGAATAVLLVAAAWVFVDVFAAPGLWCKNLCPTGFVLENVGRLAPWRLVKRGADPCPDKCDVCRRACPYGLFPKHETHRPACDNCGRCASVCPSRKLSRRVVLPVVTAVACAVTVGATAGTAEAHHNKGLPHYGYFENYPQVPTEEYIVVDGGWEFGATVFNFQGLARKDADTPNDVKIYCYLYDLSADAAYLGAADFEIRRDGEVVSRFSRERPDEESVYSTRETLPATGDYELVAIVGGTEVSSLDFYVDLDEEGVSWLLVGGIALPVMLVFGLALLGRRQKWRKAGVSRAGRARKAGAATVVLALALGLGAGAADAGTAGPDRDRATTTEHAGDADGEVCPDCGMVGCTMEHAVADDGTTVMIMGGIPLWLFLAGVGGLLLVTFAGTELLGARAGRGFRKNLIRSRKLYRVVRSRWFQTVPQLAMIAVFGFLIYAGLAGNRIGNIAPVAVWTLWWGGLIFAVLLLASAWCFVCPWDGLANLFSRLRVAARVEPLSLGLRVPPWLRTVYPAIALFALLTWLELGFGVTTDPRSTAYMGLGMAALAITFALLFEGKAFCAHACPVGRICGIYSTFAPVEIRARKPRTCQACRTEDCLHGNERGYPCPTGISLKTITSSSMCTMCTECIKSCNKQNVALNLRPFGSDLREVRAPRMDEAWLAVSLLALTLFHGLTMTPAWEDLRPGRTGLLDWMAITFGTSDTVNFTVAMLAACALPVVLYALACRAGRYLAGGGVPAKTLFASYAYSLLPVALFYHLAHNLMHLLMEGGEIVPLLSDPLGTGADYLGTASMHPGHLVSDHAMWMMQVGLILVGHVFGIVVAHRTAHRVYRGDKTAAVRSLVPMLVVMIAISVAGLYLMHLDMNMRVGRM